MHDAERVIADPVVRNRGTIGGSLGQADPAEDLTTVCDVLRAQVVIRGAAGERVLDIAEFHRGPYETACEQDELLTEIRFPIRARSRQRLREGRAAGRRLGGRRRPGAALWMAATARSRTPRSGSTALGLEGCADRARGPCWRVSAPSEDLFAEAAPARPRRPARRSRTSAARSTTSATSPTSSPGGCCAARSTAPPTPPPSREADHAGHDDRQRDRGHPRRRTPAAARALPARDARPHRHPLGVRHQQLRHLRGARRRRTGEVVHRAGRHDRRARGAHRRGAGRAAARSTRCSRASWRSTACSAASAPPA